MSESIDRRRFLGSAAIGVAASGLSVSARSNVKYDSPNTRVVVGIMGMSRGRRFGREFRPTAQRPRQIRVRRRFAPSGKRWPTRSSSRRERRLSK